MSNKQEIKSLVISLLFCGGIIGSLVYFLIPHTNIPTDSDRISKGERILVNNQTNSDKEAGATAYAQGDFPLAERKFKDSLEINPNDPEALIYLNNAQIGKSNAFKIVVSVPINTNQNVAQEMLRGVAQAQDEVNNQGGIKGRPLQVEIANDDNDPKIAKQLAESFVKDSEVIAVIGHNSSNASLAAAPIYEGGKLVMISPTSSSQQLSSMGKYIFRTVFDIRLIAERLADYAVKVLHKKNVTVCLDSKSIDNQSFSNEFIKAFLNNGAKLVNIECDLAAPNFNAEDIVSKAIAKGSDSILLAPYVDRINKAMEVVRANNKRLTLLGSNTLYTRQTLDEGGANVNGLVLVTPWHPSQYPNHPFLKGAKDLWKAPVNWRTATSYDATLTVIKGLKQGADRQTLAEVFHNGHFSFDGATGVVQFLPSGDRQKGKVVLIQVQSSTKNPTGYDFVPLK